MAWLKDNKQDDEPDEDEPFPEWLELDLSVFQDEVGEWTSANFPDTQAWGALLGVGEEIGELNHAFLKMTQGIRGSEETHLAAMRDAIGDAFVYMTHFAILMGFDIEQCIIDTWEEVKTRNWIINRDNGDVGDTGGGSD